MKKTALITMQAEIVIEVEINSDANNTEYLHNHALEMIKADIEKNGTYIPGSALHYENEDCTELVSLTNVTIDNTWDAKVHHIDNPIVQDGYTRPELDELAELDMKNDIYAQEKGFEDHEDHMDHVFGYRSSIDTESYCDSEK